MPVISHLSVIASALLEIGCPLASGLPIIGLFMTND